MGGQAGTSSLIRNYPGFSRGVSGAHLAFRSFQQAWAFGTEYSFLREVQAPRHRGRAADGLDVRRQRRPQPQRGHRHRRRLPPPRRPRARGLVGPRVYYGAAVSRLRRWRGRTCTSSAGELGRPGGAAPRPLRASGDAARAGPSLAASMSDYLIAQLEATRNVSHPLPARRCRAVAQADGCLGRLTLGEQRGGPGEGEEVPAAAASSCSSARCPARSA